MITNSSTVAPANQTESTEYCDGLATSWADLATSGRPTREPISEPRWSTSAELASCLGGLELGELLPWHRELASAVADLASRADLPWPVGPSDPTVALLRIVAVLAEAAPTTASPLAGQLLDALEPATAIDAAPRPAMSPPTSRT